MATAATKAVRPAVCEVATSIARIEATVTAIAGSKTNTRNRIPRTAPVKRLSRADMIMTRRGPRPGKFRDSRLP